MDIYCWRKKSPPPEGIASWLVDLLGCVQHKVDLNEEVVVAPEAQVAHLFVMEGNIPKYPLGVGDVEEGFRAVDEEVAVAVEHQRESPMLLVAKLPWGDKRAGRDNCLHYLADD